MSLAEEQHQPPAQVVPAAGPLPDAVTEEELMSSGHELPEGYTCPLCCLPIALPAAQHSRTPTPDSDAAMLALVGKRVDAKDPVATEFLAYAYCDGDYDLEPNIQRAISAAAPPHPASRPRSSRRGDPDPPSALRPRAATARPGKDGQAEDAPAIPPLLLKAKTHKGVPLRHVDGKELSRDPRSPAPNPAPSPAGPRPAQPHSPSASPPI
ncbi:hypothetical protein THAOC_34696, partial [Thalassiosira oceanica]